MTDWVDLKQTSIPEKAMISSITSTNVRYSKWTIFDANSGIYRSSFPIMAVVLARSFAEFSRTGRQI